MSDETSLPLGGESVVIPSADHGTPGRKIGAIDSFQGAGNTKAPPAGGGSTKGGNKGKGAGKIGRPPKNIAGFSEEKISSVVDDPEIEAARAEFEGVLVELLVCTTDSFADSKFITLKKLYPEAEARGLADKFRLTEKEKKYFGAAAIRVWRKYLGDKYLFTEEGILGVYAIQYFMRNLEGFTQIRKIEAEKNGNAKQPGLQGKVTPNPRSEANGQEHLDGTGDRHAPSAARIDL